MSIVLPFIEVTMEQTSNWTLTTCQFSFVGLTGEGFATGEVPLLLTLRFGLALAFEGDRFELGLVLFELPLFAFLFVAGRLLFALRFPVFVFEESFAFLLVFLLRLGLFSFAGTGSFVFRLSVFSSGVASATAGAEDSPSFTVRLISIATVCPAFTTSPPRGNWNSTVSAFDWLGRVARTRKFKPALPKTRSASNRSFPTTSGTITSGLRRDK
jgi:hypothetical protein